MSMFTGTQSIYSILCHFLPVPLTHFVLKIWYLNIGHSWLCCSEIYLLIQPPMSKDSEDLLLAPPHYLATLRVDLQQPNPGYCFPAKACYGWPNLSEWQNVFHTRLKEDWRLMTITWTSLCRCLLLCKETPDLAVGHLAGCGPGSWQKALPRSNVMLYDMPVLLKTSGDTCATSFMAHAI